MIPKADHQNRRVLAAGVDAGATLTKIAARDDAGQLHFQLVSSQAIERAAREVEQLCPEHLGLTGGGSPQLARHLELDTAPVDEFEALHAGARILLERQGEAALRRDLLVSLGTGTSLLLLEPDGCTRVGGTALGGGTLLGLGAALVGSADYAELVKLAAQGDRRRADLLVGDLDPHGVIPLPRELNASSFAKLGHPGAGAGRPEDLAHALMGLLGENVAIIAAATAALHSAGRLIFAGSTLRENAPLREILAGVAAAGGRPACFLEDGEFAGAVGAMELAEARPRKLARV